MLEYLTLILVCQLIGEIAVATMDAPFPGPVLGMVLLFIFLLFKREVPEHLGHVAGALLNNLSLLFVPAGVGVMVHLRLLGTEAWPLSVALLGSTLLTVVVTALVMVSLNRVRSRNRSKEGGI